MRLVVAGRADEIRGFALAGVETAECHSVEHANAVLSGVSRDVGLLIVSAWVAQAAEDRLRAVRDRKGPPVVLTLPGDR
jgi:vacuolar-type H+-ATPase subunit F/Vma7